MRMDILTAIESEPLNRIQDIAFEQKIHSHPAWLDYDALNKALECERTEVARWLIGQCVRVNKVSNDDESMLGSTPLHNAVKLHDMGIIETLLERKASIVAVDHDNNTALHIAFLHRCDKITNFLLGHVVKISNFTNVKNNQGLTHWHIASTLNNVNAIEGLVRAEGNVNDASKADSWASCSALHFAIEFQLLEAQKFLLAVASEMENAKGHNSVPSPTESLHQRQVETMMMHLVIEDLDKCTFPHFHLACLKERLSMVKEFINRGADLNETIVWGVSHCHHYSPLECAVESPYDRKEKVQLLLQHGAVVKQRECHWKCQHMTALHLAFYNEYRMSHKDLDSTIVDSLYRAVKDKEENIEDEYKLSYFHVAVSRNDFDMVETYLAKGANINSLVLHNVHGFSGCTPLQIALKYELMDMAKFLIECGACFDVGQDNEYKTSLCKAVQKLRLLDQPRAEIASFLLHYAVVVGNHELVQSLVDSGCDVNVWNSLRQTPILLSLKADLPCKKIIEILLEAGASINFVDNFRNRALKILDTNAFLSEDVEKFEIYKVFLEKTFRAEEMDFTQLWLLTSGNENDIEMLLQTNVDLSVKDCYENTLVHALARNCNPGVIEQLRGRRFDVDARDCNGNTPLMGAASYGNVNAAEFLLDLGADIEAVNIHGETAFLKSIFCYIEEGDKECTHVLMEHGANVQIEIAEGPLLSIFDVILRHNASSLGNLVLAHLALQELKGTAITQCIQRTMDSHEQFKNFFQRCKQLLSVEIYPSITVLNVLTASQRKLECYLKNEELASKLKDFQTVEYFDTMLTRRLTRAFRMTELREAAVPIISKLVNADYNRIPSIVDDILSYFLQEDIEYLISIESELQLDSYISNNV